MIWIIRYRRFILQWNCSEGYQDMLMEFTGRHERKFGEGDPVRNNDIVVGSRLLENLRKVQLANGLFADNVLAEGNNGLT